MKTCITDYFPLDKLECQYFDLCKFYDPEKCSYNSPCTVRTLLKNTLEVYVGEQNVKMQTELIFKDWVEEESKKQSGDDL